MTKSYPENKRLSFGIMCSGGTLHQWQADAVKRLLDSGAECKLLIVDDNPPVKRSFWGKVAAYFSKNGLYRFYLRFFFRPRAKKEVNLDAVIPGKVDVLKCITKKVKYSEYFDDRDVEYIRSKKLDFILRFGFNIIRGKILDSAGYGVWSFHHDDEQKYRGGPPGFWEIMNGDPVTGAVLQRLTDKLDGGIILKKGFFPTTDHSYEGQIDRLYFDTSGWPALVCNDILSGRADYFKEKPSTTGAKIFKAPSNAVMISFLFRLLRNKVRFHYQELFMPEQWNIAVAEEHGNEPDNIRWFPDPGKGRFFADPFGAVIDGDLHVFFEDYRYSSRKGVISRSVYINGVFSPPKRVLEEEHHLSYPFVFEHEGEIFCVPESVAANRIALYQYDRKKEEFVFKKVLIEDFPGVDPTLFEYDGKWWLFCTHGDHSNTELHIFYSETPFRNFKPHSQNPVKTDICHSRPGGRPFMMNGAWYRPAQNSAVTYGSKVVINKILELTEERFKEEPVREVRPVKDSGYGKGLHTYSKAGAKIIIDGKRFRFDKHNFWFQLKRKCKSV